MLGVIILLLGLVLIAYVSNHRLLEVKQAEMRVCLIRICSILGKWLFRFSNGLAESDVIQVVQKSATHNQITSRGLTSCWQRNAQYGLVAKMQRLAQAAPEQRQA